MGSWITERWQAWRDRRFLKRHGCETWQQYHKQYDPDYNIRADRIRDYYHGYSYIHCFRSYEHYAYRLLYDYGPGGYRHGYDDIQEWVLNNCSRKARFDFLRVLELRVIDQGGNAREEWYINEIGGGDLIFAAFKDERDYMMFLLRWA